MSITVLTFSVDRPADLRRCIESILGQRDSPPIRHLVLSENAAALCVHPLLRDYRDAAEWVPLLRQPQIGHASPRMAKLRQAALQRIETEMVCFLDDDNYYAPSHLASLSTLLLRRDLSAVHSWRTLVYPDGTPFDGRSFPWHPDTGVARELQEWCVAHGVFEVDSPIVKDGLRDSGDWRNVATVDMNEWLFRTGALRALGFETDFTTDELANQVGEDDKLLRRIRAAGWKIASTDRATVIYQLGGVSNRAAARR
jgi:hypothetical protein